ncbi:Zn-dependent hydrolase [Natronococcus sp. A-GB7]|uniref:Zn-dependent hydrolase n=1 Tax=Natronococcus sp. A-GB7 TaxID=3037649 RepID=UPI00241CBAF6|nr:Zn-dependent hydrolase [Natronococcus sp. A-GB7]MDG5820750.1 Zn-dependent hydrolase [Natronococcus sp. A-GB7]
MKVDKDRLRENILTNGTLGSTERRGGNGRTVLTGSMADGQAREYLVGQLRSLDLDVRVDPVGNIAGRWEPDGCPEDANPVAAGSHLDSVPQGGLFDGPLGVYAAVEAVRTLQESDLTLERPIEVVSFTEEEGQRFNRGLLGSSVAAGELSASEALTLEDDTGTTLSEYLEDIGFRGEQRIDAGEWDSWLELHIEQSTMLEDTGVSSGIVTSVTGITNCRVEISGEADHAGSTRMDGRTDCLVAASEFIRDIERIATELVATKSEFAVATVGEVTVTPNARNVVPGSVTLSVDIRDVDLDVMDEIVALTDQSLARLERERGVDTALDRYRTVEPVPMSKRCQRALADASNRNGIETRRLPSGGGHDTMQLASVTDVGMLFAPSKDGISHSPQEWTAWEECTRATQILTGALADLAGAVPIE